MFWLLRRMFWFGTGATVGFGGAMWVRNRLRRAVTRYAPEHLPAQVAEGARRVGGRVGRDARRVGEQVSEAIAEGRSTARNREAELRRDLALPPEDRPSVGREGQRH